MASTYTANNGMEKPATGDRSGTWGTMTNTNMDIIDRATSGVGAITLSGTTHTLTTTDGSLTDGMYKVLVLGGSPSGTNTITISPNDQDKLYFVVNSSGQTATFTQGTGANVSIPNGGADIIYADGAGAGAAVASLLSKTLTTGNIIIPDAGNIGSASDTDAIAVSSAGVVALSATTEASATTTAALTVAGGLGVAKDVWIGDDLVLDSDSTVISLGADQDVTVTHVADSGVTFKNTSTGDDTPFVLLIQTGETDIAADDVLGKIQFQAPDEGAGTDAILVAAEVAAVSEGDFSSSSNATKLSFKTGASEAATEKMSISSVGNVTMKQTETGDDTPMTLLLQTGETDIAANDVLGKIQFQAPDEGTGTDAILVAAEIAAFSEGDFSSSSNATSLSFKTGASEAATQKMVINSAGEVGIGTGASSTTQLYVFNNETGHIVGYFHQDNASNSDTALYSLHDGSGTGVYGYAGGIGVRGHSTGNAGVYGTSAAANYGGYFTSTGSYGVYAKTTSSGTHGGLLAYDDGSTYCILGYSPSSTAYSFYGNGDGYITGTFSSSDSRLKDIQSRITTSDGILAKINQLKPTYYKWKSDSDQGQKDNSEQIGLIAQEVESVFSHIVKEAPVPDLSESPPDADGKVEKRDKTLNEELGDTKFITYEKLTVYLTAALQEASAKIDALETRIAALESS